MDARLQPVYDLVSLCAAWGVRDAIICPGSRSAPLTLAFARHPSIRTRVITDERAAAFMGLGIAQQRHLPVAIVCTSGSAGLNFAPAVAEAFYQHVPLIVFTADRPSEWIDQWDGQTIRQQHLFGHHVLHFVQMPHDYTHPDSIWFMNRALQEALHKATGPEPGPVHINVPLREPLYPGSADEITFPQVRNIKPVAANENAYALPATLLTELKKSNRVMILTGQQVPAPGLERVLCEIARQQRAVVVTDILGNISDSAFLFHTDQWLPHLPESAQEALVPDLLITTGKSVISKQLKIFLRKFHGRYQHWHVQASHSFPPDPFQSLTHFVQANPASFFQALAQAVTTTPAFYGVWQSAEVKVRQSVDHFLASHREGELGLLHVVMTHLPQAEVHVANSMSVRYLNVLTRYRLPEVTAVWSNRGTSGIDGCSSTAVGHALASPDKLHVLITGDLAFFYDRNAFWHTHLPANLRIILLNNQGGIIFRLIDGPGELPERDEFFVAQQSRTAAHTCRDFGIAYHCIRSFQEVDSNAPFFTNQGGCQLVEIHTAAEFNQTAFESLKQLIRQNI